MPLAPGSFIERRGDCPFHFLILLSPWMDSPAALTQCAFLSGRQDSPYRRRRFVSRGCLHLWRLAEPTGSITETG